VGVLLAAVCDVRIGAQDATVACPEIDYGLVAGSGGLLSWLKVPEGLLREMYYTGDRIPARRMLESGFFNRLVARAEVVGAAQELAQRIATKDLADLQARKRASNALEGLPWKDAYLLTQAASTASSASPRAHRGVRDFLEGRSR
jgi:enoyl-CoA hydratase/carnithine racemase